MLPPIIVGVVLLLVAVVVIMGKASGSGKDAPDVELSIPARDTLIGSARRLQDVGRRIDPAPWRYDTPACVVLSDYYGGYFTQPKHRDQTTDDIKVAFMAGGGVRVSLQAHVQVFNLPDHVAEITEAAMACSEYIATQH
jgi:hypothetical protein